MSREESDSTNSSESTITGLYSLRREIVAEIEAKELLEPLEDPETINDITQAVRELHIKKFSEPPEEVIETIESIYEELPQEAKQHFVTDSTLIRRINAARNYFDTYAGRVKRDKQMPSAVEAGPAKYDTKKAQRLLDSRMKGQEEFGEKVDRIRAGAKGARGRALEQIGSSIAEQNEKDRENTREARRENLEQDDIVAYRNPYLQVGHVVRVNKKSIRVSRPNPRAGNTKPLSDEIEPDTTENRIQLDSEHLTPLITDEAVENFNRDVDNWTDVSMEDLTTVEEVETHLDDLLEKFTNAE